MHLEGEAADLATVRRFQSEVASIREAEEPMAVRMTVKVLAIGIVVCVLLSMFAKVDRIVTSQAGKIVPTVRPTVYQALDDNSIIKSIDVKEGERVVKGQVLATLDPTFTGADVAQLTDQMASLNAQIIRDDAELKGAAPDFPNNDDPVVQKYASLQRELSVQRSAQYKAQLDSFDQKIDQTLATIQKAEGDEKGYRQRDAIAGRVDDMRGKLIKSGAGSLLNKLTSEDAHAEMQRSLENARNAVNEAQHQLASVRADREAFIQNWRAQVSQDVVTARNNRAQAEAQLEKAQKHKELVRLVAPDDAVVLTVTKLSVGSVLHSADQVVSLALLSAPVEAEVNISTRDVGFVRVGDEATVKVDAFNYTQHGTAKGSVKWISEGAFTMNDDTGQPAEAPYYRARVRIDDMNFVDVPANFRLIPGMTLTGDIKVGRRTLASYIWESAVKGASEAMREP